MTGFLTVRHFLIVWAVSLAANTRTYCILNPTHSIYSKFTTLHLGVGAVNAYLGRTLKQDADSKLLESGIFTDHVPMGTSVYLTLLKCWLCRQHCPHICIVLHNAHFSKQTIITDLPETKCGCSSNIKFTPRRGSWTEKDNAIANAVVCGPNRYCTEVQKH